MVSLLLVILITALSGWLLSVMPRAAVAWQLLLVMLGSAVAGWIVLAMLSAFLDSRGPSQETKPVITSEWKQQYRILICSA